MGLKEMVGWPSARIVPSCETCRASCCYFSEFYNMSTQDIETMKEGNLVIECETRDEYEETIRQHDKTPGVFVVWNKTGKLTGRCGNLINGRCGVQDHKPKACINYPVNGDDCQKHYQKAR